MDILCLIQKLNKKLKPLTHWSFFIMKIGDGGNNNVCEPGFRQ